MDGHHSQKGVPATRAATQATEESVDETDDSSVVVDAPAVASGAAPWLSDLPAIPERATVYVEETTELESESKIDSGSGSDGEVKKAQPSEFSQQKDEGEPVYTTADSQYQMDHAPVIPAAEPEARELESKSMLSQHSEGGSQPSQSFRALSVCNQSEELEMAAAPSAAIVRAGTTAIATADFLPGVPRLTVDECLVGNAAPRYRSKKNTDDGSNRAFQKFSSPEQAMMAPVWEMQEPSARAPGLAQQAIASALNLRVSESRSEDRSKAAESPSGCKNLQQSRTSNGSSGYLSRYAASARGQTPRTQTTVHSVDESVSTVHQRQAMTPAAPLIAETLMSMGSPFNTPNLATSHSSGSKPSSISISQVGDDNGKEPVIVGLADNDITAVNDMADAFQECVNEYKREEDTTAEEVMPSPGREFVMRRLSQLDPTLMILSFSLGLAAVILSIYGGLVFVGVSDYVWLSMVAGIYPLHLAARVSIAIATNFVQWKFKLHSKVMLYLVVMTKPSVWLVWSVLLLTWWCVIVLVPETHPAGSVNSDRLESANFFAIRGLVCHVLFRLINVLKVLISRGIALSFLRHAHFARMQQAFMKEHLIAKLCVHRAREQKVAPARPVSLTEDLIRRGSTKEGVSYPPLPTEDGAKDSVESVAGNTSGEPSFGWRLPWASLLEKRDAVAENVNLKRVVVTSSTRESPGEAGLEHEMSSHANAHGDINEAFNWAETLTTEFQRSPRKLSRAGSTNTVYSQRSDAVWANMMQPSRRKGRSSMYSSAYSPSRSHMPAKVSTHLSVDRLSSRVSYLEQFSTAVPGSCISEGDQERETISGDAMPVQWEDLPIFQNSDSTTQGTAAGKGKEAAQVMAIADYIKNTCLNFTLPSTLSSAVATAMVLQVGSIESAKSMAYFLFWNILPPNQPRRYITVDDVNYFFSDPEKAGMAFAMLDSDHDGVVTASDICTAITEIYRERRNLTSTLEDTGGVVSKLQSVVSSVMHSAMFFAYLAIFKLDVSNLWITLSSVLLAFAFVFGNSIKTVYENVIFLFVVHPYDVGDKIRVPHDTGNFYTVEEINMMSTSLCRWDNCSITFTNAYLSQQNLLNVSRSRIMQEGYYWNVDWRHAAQTDPEVIPVIKRYVSEAMSQLPSEYATDEPYVVWISASTEPGKIRLGVFQAFSHNGSDYGRLMSARSYILQAVAKAFMELDIKWSMPSQSSTRDGKAVITPFMRGAPSAMNNTTSQPLDEKEGEDSETNFSFPDHTRSEKSPSPAFANTNWSSDATNAAIVQDVVIHPAVLSPSDPLWTP